MAEDGLSAWKILFGRALRIIDAVAAPGARLEDWSLGGGTVLMLRFRHRVSKDVDIFVPDPQWLGYVIPRLNETAEELTQKYLETAISVKLYFPEGEADFIASGPLTGHPVSVERVLGREVRLDSTAETIAKKVQHRAREFTARDLFDLALVASRDPASIEAIRPILRRRRALIRQRIAAGERALRTAFAALDTLDYRPGFDECVRAVLETLEAA